MINSEKIWGRIIKYLSSTKFELQTTTGFWYNAYIIDDSLIINNSIENTPATNLSKPRKITKKDFHTVCSYYDRWHDGEVGIRHEVSRKSRNTAYIFGLIEKFN